MIAKHLTDDEIQQYALDSSNCEIKIVEHVLHCEECKARAETYQLLFEGIKQMSVPAFDFNLSELVLAKLPSPKSRFSPDRTLVYLLALISILITGVLFYIFREYLFRLFSAIKPFFIYLLMTTVISLLIILCFDMHKNYQKKMKALDFY